MVRSGHNALCCAHSSNLLGLFAKDKQHCVDDVGLATAIGTNYS